MPRPKRQIIPGYIYHLTHRCHDGDFLLRFAQDRDTYRKWLREGKRRYGISLLNYDVTCNHVHLVAMPRKAEQLSQFMQFVESRTAQQYNKRKERKGAFWEDRYHCTIIDTGIYLWNCLLYVDLNMVRAGVVKTPEEWEWCGYREMMGLRKRYTVLDMETLLEKLDYDDMEEFREKYREEIKTRIRRGETKRNPVWTESLAVGNSEFVRKLKGRFGRMKIEFARKRVSAGTSVWSIREARAPYS